MDKQAGQTGTGMLFLCATPIGNLGDMTFRAVETLQKVDLIAAEDTRRTQKLLNHFGITTPVTSYFEHNKEKKGRFLLELLLEGKQIALVSDAGLPGISDPGNDLVALAVSSGVPVTVIPGVNAALTALVISGLPTDRFAFEGFLPRDKKKRREVLNELTKERRTMIFYEAPHRLQEVLVDMLQTWGERRGVIARELTKVYEEVIRGTLAELVLWSEARNLKGEFTLIIEGNPTVIEDLEQPWKELSIVEHAKLMMAQGLEKKEAMKQVAKLRGISKRDVYQELLGVSFQKED